MMKGKKKVFCLFSSLNCLITELNRYQSQYRGGRGPGQAELGTEDGLHHSPVSCLVQLSAAWDYTLPPQRMLSVLSPWRSVCNAVLWEWWLV